MASEITLIDIMQSQDNGLRLNPEATYWLGVDLFYGRNGLDKNEAAYHSLLNFSYQAGSRWALRDFLCQNIINPQMNEVTL